MACQVRYKGYVPKEIFSFDLEKVDASIDANKFFNDFVSKRKPVVIKHLTEGDEWGISKWGIKYLREMCGDEEVQVEKIIPENDSRSFGYKIPKVSMKYKAFLDELEQGTESSYMTTQEFDCKTGGYGLSLGSLQDDVPLCPSLLSPLVPHQVSLWQGRSLKGSSSGLHHDFHDNLYVLIRGRKRFFLKFFC